MAEPTSSRCDKRWLPRTARRPRSSLEDAQGYKALLEGRGPLPGFGDQLLSHFTRDRVATWLPDYQELVAAGKRARHRVHGPGAQGPREGASATIQLANAARALSRYLAEVGMLRLDTMQHLQSPKPRGPLREPSLNETEGSSYLKQVLLHSNDPELDALLWTLFTYWGPRQIELLRGQVPGSGVALRAPS